MLNRRNGLGAAFLKPSMVAAALQICLWVCGCNDFGGAHGSSSGNVVDNHPPYVQWSSGATPVLQVGAAMGADPLEFQRIVFAGRLRDGRVVVVDAGAREIRWFDAAGRHRSTVGRRGEGPGEYRDIRSAHLTADDSLLVYDRRNQRITWFSPRETRVREQRVVGFQNPDTRLLSVWTGNRVVLSEARSNLTVGRSDFTYTRDSVAFATVSSDATDTVAVFPGSEATTWVQYVGGRPQGTMQMELPFGFQVLTGATRRDLVVAVGDRGEIEIRDESGKLVRIARRGPLAATIVSNTARREYVDQMTATAKTRGAPDVSLVTNGARDRLALLPKDHTVPPFDRLLVDREDRIWVRDYLPIWQTADRVQAWTVYSPSGRVLARVDTPAGVEVTSVDGGYLTGVKRDESDVEYVVVYRYAPVGRPRG